MQEHTARTLCHWPSLPTRIAFIYYFKMQKQKPLLKSPSSACKEPPSQPCSRKGSRHRAVPQPLITPSLKIALRLILEDVRASVWQFAMINGVH